MTSPAMQQMLDEFAILKVLQRYSHGVDRCDRALLEGCYWDDATDDHGIYNGSAIGFVDFVIPLLLKSYSATSHFLGQSLITVSGNEAAAETYVLAAQRLTDDSTPTMNMLGGRYVDRFERRGGEWRIAARRLLVDWIQNVNDGQLPQGARGAALDMFENGARDGTDQASALYRQFLARGEG